MTAYGYSVTAARGAEDVSVIRGSGTHPHQVIVGTHPLSSQLFLDGPAATVVVVGLMKRLTDEDPSGAGELLDRLVGIVAGEPRG